MFISPSNDLPLASVYGNSDPPNSDPPKVQRNKISWWARTFFCCSSENRAPPISKNRISPMPASKPKLIITLAPSPDSTPRVSIRRISPLAQTLAEFFHDAPLADAIADYLLENKMELGNFIGGGKFGRVYDLIGEGKKVLKLNLPHHEGQLHISAGAFDADRGEQLAFAINHKNLIKPDAIFYWQKDTKSLVAVTHCENGKLVNAPKSESSFVGAIMPKIEGPSLAHIMKNKLEPKYVWNIIQQIASALAALHKHNIAHRDVKPENVKLDEAGNPVLLDLGIAKRDTSFHTTADSPPKRETPIGTEYYMAPEALQKMKPIERDIFSLGLMLHEMLYGRRLKIERLSGGFNLPDSSNPEERNLLIDMLVERIPATEVCDRIRDILDKRNSIRSERRNSAHSSDTSFPKEQAISTHKRRLSIYDRDNRLSSEHNSKIQPQINNLVQD